VGHQGKSKTLTKDLVIDGKGEDNASKRAVMMNDLAYHHLVMWSTDKAFYFVQAVQDMDENGNARQAELC